MPIKKLFVLLMLSWIALPALLGQSQHPKLSVESNLVLVDLVARDKSGQPVLDLTAKDLSIPEDGKFRQITFFQLLNYAPGVDRLLLSTFQSRFNSHSLRPS